MTRARPEDWRSDTALPLSCDPGLVTTFLRLRRQQQHLPLSLMNRTIQTQKHWDTLPGRREACAACPTPTPHPSCHREPFRTSPLCGPRLPLRFGLRPHPFFVVWMMALISKTLRSLLTSFAFPLFFLINIKQNLESGQTLKLEQGVWTSALPRDCWGTQEKVPFLPLISASLRVASRIALRII